MVSDLQNSLKINKDCIKILIEPQNGLKGINVIHSFVKENIKLQEEVFNL